MMLSQQRDGFDSGNVRMQLAMEKMCIIQQYFFDIDK